jgi:hypothetical protein
VEIVTLLPLVAIVPVSVPVSVPPPVTLLSVIVVLLVGLAGLPLASCDCTVTLNAVPAVPVVGTVVYASFVAAPAFTVIPVCEPVIVLVTVSVAVIDCVPAVPSVTLKPFVPLVSVELDGSTALLSELVTATIPV